MRCILDTNCLQTSNKQGGAFGNSIQKEVTPNGDIRLTLLL